MIGETIYLRNENWRVYEDDNGNRTSAPNPRHYFKPYVITGETRNSWVIIHQGTEVKVNKETFEIKYLGAGYSKRAYTAQDMENMRWLEENKHIIVRAVHNCNDVDKLRAIQSILNVGENE